MIRTDFEVLKRKEHKNLEVPSLIDLTGSLRVIFGIKS